MEISQEKLTEALEKAAEKLVTAERPFKRTVGRRWTDHVKDKSGWLLVIGVLMQGGFLWFSSRLMSIGERQMERERDAQVRQYADLASAIKDLSAAMREQTTACTPRSRP